MAGFAALLADLEGRPGPGGFTRRMRVYSSQFLSAVLERPEKALTLERQDKVIFFGGLLRGKLPCAAHAPLQHH